MISAMTGSIIGGAIAAVIGLLGALGIEMWREHRREKAIRRSIIKELMAEIKENIKLSSEIRQNKPSSFEVDIWRSSFPKLSFLPIELRDIIRKTYREAQKCNHYSDIEALSARDQIVTNGIENKFELCINKLQTWIDSN